MIPVLLDVFHKSTEAHLQFQHGLARLCIVVAVLALFAAAKAGAIHADRINQNLEHVHVVSAEHRVVSLQVVVKSLSACSHGCDKRYAVMSGRLPVSPMRLAHTWARRNYLLPRWQFQLAPFVPKSLLCAL